MSREVETQVRTVIVFPDNRYETCRKLNFCRVTNALAGQLDPVRERRFERIGHARCGNNHSAPGVLETNDELRGWNTGRLVQLPLGYKPGFDRRTIRVRPLSFTVSQLVGNVDRQIAKCRKHEGKFGLKLPRALAAGIVVQPEPSLRRSLPGGAVSEPSKACVLNSNRLS